MLSLNLQFQYPALSTGSAPIFTPAIKFGQALAACTNIENQQNNIDE